MTHPKTAAEWSWNLRHANPNYGSKTLDAIEAHNERILKLAMSEARIEGAQLGLTNAIAACEFRRELLEQFNKADVAGWLAASWEIKEVVDVLTRNRDEPEWLERVVSVTNQEK